MACWDEQRYEEPEVGDGGCVHHAEGSVTYNPSLLSLALTGSLFPRSEAMFVTRAETGGDRLSKAFLI